jgi:hypothetical protein
MMKPVADRITDEIARLHEILPSLDREKVRLAAAGTITDPGFDWRSSMPNRSFWARQAFVDALERLRGLVEEDLGAATTMQLLACTRYVFELTVWLRSIDADDRFAHAYCGDIIRNQISYHRDLRSHLTREAQWLRNIGEEETRIQGERLELAMQIPDEVTRNARLVEVMNEVTTEIDAHAARTFSVYGYDATFNSYEFQAYLVETKALPLLDQRLMALDDLDAHFEATAASDAVAVLGKGRKLNWKDRSTAVGMAEEYAFIYSYASRLLHATPSSITTSMQALDQGEVLTFLRYLSVRVSDILELAKARAA